MTGSGSVVLPNFFIAGVPKAGTSSLHNWLAAHPETLASKEKETCFFADADSHIYREDCNAARSMDGYARQFDQRDAIGKTVVFESTPAYIYQQTALRMIPGLPSQPRCLFVLREPAAQIKSVYSYYQNNWGHIPSDLGFCDYLALTRGGRATFAGNELAEHPFKHARYLDYLIPWRDALGPVRMKVITFDQLVRDPRGTTYDIAQWLGIDANFYLDFDFQSENESYQPRSRILQKMNIGLRGRMPKGAVYTALRSAYRKLNTVRPVASYDTTAALIEIRAEMATHNATLATQFDLNLSHWQ